VVVVRAAEGSPPSSKLSCNAQFHGWGVEGAEGGSTTLEIEPRHLVLQGGNGGSKRESPTLKVEPRHSILQVEGGRRESPTSEIELQCLIP